jgi:RNA polymerase sigma-70 factor (ECF subfamily)
VILPKAITSEASQRQGLRALFDEHASFVRRVIGRLGAPPSDVDDLLQEVFLVAVKKLGGFEGRSTHRTWLYGVAVRVVASARRRAKVREILGFSAGADPTDASTPARALERHEAQAQVQRALNKMSEKKRAVFILFEIEGLTGEEIAQAVGCPLKTVWTRLYHARQDFLRQLRKLGVMEDASVPKSLEKPAEDEAKTDARNEVQAFKKASTTRERREIER